GREGAAWPRGKEGTQSGRDSDVRNVETPAGVQALPGRPTVRRAEAPRRERDAQEANAGSRKAAGNPPRQGWRRRPPPGRTGRIPAPVAGPVRVLTWAGEPLNADVDQASPNRRASWAP